MRALISEGVRAKGSPSWVLFSLCGLCPRSFGSSISAHSWAYRISFLERFCVSWRCGAGGWYSHCLFLQVIWFSPFGVFCLVCYFVEFCPSSVCFDGYVVVWFFEWVFHSFSPFWCFVLFFVCVWFAVSFPIFMWVPLWVL